MDVTTRPLTPDRWGDLETVFRAKGCCMARGCWCMYYRQTGRVTRSPVAKAVDDLPVWSLACFVVPSPYRGRGVARALLRGAIAHAATHGAVALEAYPIDKPGRGHDTFLWNGGRSMFEREGFVEVARRRPGRPVMRRALGVGRT